MTAVSLAPPRALPSPAVALLVGGPLALGFHVLYSIGHGPTVVNEHGVVLGLTNDQWSALSPLWMVLVALGTVGVCRLHRAVAVERVLLAGFSLHALSAWVWPLYSLGLLVLYFGTAALGLAVWRGGVLPRWSGAALLAAVASFLPLVLWPDTVIGWTGTVLSVALEGEDLIAATAALAWTLLGVGLARHRANPASVQTASGRLPACG